MASTTATATPQQKSGLTPYNLREFYKGKVLFCTGCTGFVGKVLVEKILRSLPEVGKVYLLVRPKKDIKNIQDRLTTEILNSKIMDRLKKEMGTEEFFKLARSKLEAVGGDVEVPSIFLNTSQEKIEELYNTVHVILHSAATVGFHEPLNHAVTLNSLGPLHTLNFAKKCKKLENFLHVSTAYTQSNKPNHMFVEEKQYPLVFPKNEEIDTFCARVSAMKDPAEVKKLQKYYLTYFKFPNTYTFTKNMAEHLVSKHRGHVPVSIFRPTIIGSAAFEPHPGWVDVASASGAIYLSGGVGNLYVIAGDGNNISDHIPVDYVVNGMLITACAMATECKKQGKSLIKTFCCGSSSNHPVTWGQSFDSCNRYWQTHQPKRALFTPDMHISPTAFEFYTRKLIEHSITRQFYEILASVFKNKGILDTANILAKRERRADLIDITYRHFVLNEWIFDSSNMQELYTHLSDEEKKIFNLDVKKIEWFTYFQYYCWGMHKMVLKENPSEPTTVDVTRTFAVDWFSDVTFSYAATTAFNNKRSREELMRQVLTSQSVQQEIQREVQRKSLSYQQVQNRANKIMDLMFADPKPTVVRFLAWFFRKIWRVMYQSIIISDDDIVAIKNLTKNKSNGPLIIIPTHRSYIDFLILSYLFFAYDLPVPHIAAGEDFLNMFIVRNLFRHSGAFFLRRQFGDDALYSAIFGEYVQQLLQDGCPLEFFVEGTRSRAGKTLQPKFGLLSIICDAYLEKKIPNLTFLPVHISYEKLIESEGYTSELLGDKKKPETLENLIKARTVLNKKHGDIFVKFAKPISLHEYASQYVQTKQQKNVKFDPYVPGDARKDLVRHVGYKIAYELDKAVVCMPTAIIATILLTHREGVALEQLIDKSNWLREMIKQRGYRVHWSIRAETDGMVVAKAVALMKGAVLYQKDMIEPNVSNKQEKNFIQLAVYRNQLVHIFAQEGIMCIALLSAGNFALKTGVERTQLLKEASSLNDLLRAEFFTQDDPDKPSNLNNTLEMMIKRGILMEHPATKKICVAEGADYTVQFLSKLVWPFVEAYWLTCTALFSVQLSGKKEPVKENVAVQRIQWIGEKFYAQNKMQFFESIAIETIKNAAATLIQMGVLTRTKKVVANPKKNQAPFEFYIELSEKYRDTNEVLKLVDNVAKFRYAIITSNQLPQSVAANISLVSKL